MAVGSITRFSVEHVFSTNGGSSWNAVPDSMMFQTLFFDASPNDDKTLVPFGAMDLAVGTTYRFGVRVARVEGTANPGFYCANFVQVRNRNAGVAAAMTSNRIHKRCQPDAILPPSPGRSSCASNRSSLVCAALARGRGERHRGRAELRRLHRRSELERVLPERGMAEEPRHHARMHVERRFIVRTTRSRGCRWPRS